MLKFAWESLQVFALNDHVIIFMLAQQELYVSLLALFKDNGLRMKLRSLVSTFDVCCQNSCARRVLQCIGCTKRYKLKWVPLIVKFLLVVVRIKQIFESFNGVIRHLWHSVPGLNSTIYTKSISQPGCRNFQPVQWDVVMIEIRASAYGEKKCEKFLPKNRHWTEVYPSLSP